MPTRTLQLRYTPTPARETLAWWIPGGDPQAWLDELTSWQVAQSALRLLIVPENNSRRQPAGVLVLESATAAPSARCVRYGRIGTRLWLPAGAQFDVAATHDELEQKLGTAEHYVWHPHAGLVAFERRDVRRVADLLPLFEEHESDWSCAAPGVAYARRLISISPDVPATLEQLLKQAAGDIGSQNDDLDALPEFEDEPQDNPLANAGRQAEQWLAHSARWFAQTMRSMASGLGSAGGAAGGSGAGGGFGAAAGPGWLERLENWANGKLEHLRQDLDTLRNRELSRLMKLLESDPDLGLKFALPMGGGAPRGVAPPGTRLTPRDVNFSLGGLGGGGPVDYWDVPNNYQQQLTQRYRELAQRELRLGRHRRAAYIYAELLADLTAAANALESGQHWREAAILYRDRLHRPQEAARCLEAGHLWTEAIELYVQLQQYERAGDLYVKLEEADEAREMYQQAVAQLKSYDDRLHAAEVLEQKLHDVDGAIETLASAWPVSAQLEPCLLRLFERLAAHARHDDARRQIERLHSGAIAARRQHDAAAVLVQPATEYPDPVIRHQAADATRLLVSSALVGGPQTGQHSLLGLLSRLVPQDRLLARDCQRYPQQRSRRKPPAARSVQKTRNLRLVRRMILTDVERPVAGLHHANTVWTRAVWSGDGIYAAGIGDGQLRMLRCPWEDDYREGIPAWSIGHGLDDAPIILAAAPSSQHILLHVVGAPVLDRVQELRAPWQTTNVPIESMKGMAQAFSQRITVGPVSGMSPGVLGADQCGAQTVLVESRQGQALVIWASGSDASSLEIFTPPGWYDDSVLPVPIHARSGGTRQAAVVYLALLDKLLRVTPSGMQHVIECDHQILSLVGSAPHTRTRLAVAHDEGGRIFWDRGGPESLAGKSFRFAHDHPAPAIGFNRAGYLIAASVHGCEVYATQDERLELQAVSDAPQPLPLSVLAGPRSDQFAILTAAGSILFYELP